MNIKLKCVSAPKKGRDFTVGAIYENPTISSLNKFNRFIKVRDDGGRRQNRTFRFTNKKNIMISGFVFKILLMPVMK